MFLLFVVKTEQLATRSKYNLPYGNLNVDGLPLHKVLIGITFGNLPAEC